MTTILHLDSSARHAGSYSRPLTEAAVARVGGAGAKVLRRDLVADQPELIDEAWVTANFTPAPERSAEQKQRLAGSDALVEELTAADVIVLGVPIYNFGVPGALKAWMDLVARAGLTFRYSENGPEGLLKGKRAYVVHTSGGTPVGSEIDFCSGFVRHFLGFLGISDVTTIAADGLMGDEAAGLEKARTKINRLPVDSA
ncbi:MAG: NAD(P)H-dependent oxidoreductase [Pseudomonadota bacterium]